MCARCMAPGVVPRQVIFTISIEWIKHCNGIFVLPGKGEIRGNFQLFLRILNHNFPEEYYARIGIFAGVVKILSSLK